MQMVSEVLAAVFIDDISINLDTEEEYVQHVRAVMDTLRKYNFKVKDCKCTFGRSETECVDYRVSGDGIRLLEQKISSIINWLITAPLAACHFSITYRKEKKSKLITNRRLPNRKEGKIIAVQQAPLENLSVE
jgi:hypothetical protein